MVTEIDSLKCNNLSISESDHKFSQLRLSERHAGKQENSEEYSQGAAYFIGSNYPW